MTVNPSDDPYKNLGRRPPAFRPHFTLGLLYLVGLFILFAIVLILPSFLELLAEAPTGPQAEQELYDAAFEIGRAARSRIVAAAALSIATVVIGTHYKVLPGMKDY